MARFVSFDGTQLAYESVGTGPPVVLLHGFASDSFINWIRPGVEDALKAAGFTVITLDQRGHGASDKPHDPEAYADGAMVKDFAAFLDHLGVDEADAAGYSMGSHVLLRTIAAGEPRIRRAILGGLGENALVPTERHTAIADALEAEDRHAITDPFAKSFRDFAELTRQDRAALAASQRAPRTWVTPDTGAVKIPVLVLVADTDPLIGDASKLADAISGAKLEVVGGTHLNVVNNPAFRDAMVRFLKQEA